MSGSVEDPSLSARLHKRQAEIENSEIADLTIADRLTRRALNQRITIDLGSEDDPIPVEVRVPTSAELDLLIGIKDRLADAETQEERKAVEESMIVTIAGICIDPSLDVEFWESGLFPVESMLMITTATNREAVERVRAAREFRPSTGGAGAVSSVQGVRKTTARDRKL